MLRKHCEHIGMNAEARKLFKSPFLPTLFDPCDDSDASSGLIASAIRQNIKGAMVNPLTACQWVHLTLQAAGVTNDAHGHFSFENVQTRRQMGQSLVKQFEGLISSYHVSVEREGVVQTHVTPPVKKMRKTRKADAKSAAARILAHNLNHKLD